jgi:hypothetical protein
MATTLDPQTQALVDKRNELLSMESRSEAQGHELIQLNNTLDALGLAYQSNDPIYDDYLRSLHRTQLKDEPPLSPEGVEAQNQFMRKILEGLE